MATDCIIENWIMKNKTWLGFLVGIVTVWVVSVIGVMLFKYWYFNLSWSSSRISLSNILSLGSAIGSIAVAVFAWMAYWYATEQYMKNEITKLKFNKIYEVLDEIATGIGYFSKNLLEIKSKCNVLMRIWNQNQYSKDKSIMLTDIPNLERKLVLYMFEKIMQNSDLSAANLKLISLGVDLKLAKAIETNISSYTKYIMSLSEQITEGASTTMIDISQINLRYNLYDVNYKKSSEFAATLALNSRKILNSTQLIHQFIK